MPLSGARFLQRVLLGRLCHFVRFLAAVRALLADSQTHVSLFFLALAEAFRVHMPVLVRLYGPDPQHLHLLRADAIAGEQHALCPRRIQAGKIFRITSFLISMCIEFSTTFF